MVSIAWPVLILSLSEDGQPTGAPFETPPTAAPLGA